ncbi:hypothetical protein ARMSODRAFT_371983 [Armillaria solidipes]|uniref:Uncharacterized protein n=1 Tax=Armillaria solidipes TaxID=1076256 RepID=A0A2H3B927_9AGAR|nr:hypothetical protein ARMSODRAFT_371983 [Armillaria solidipes]
MSPGARTTETHLGVTLSTLVATRTLNLASADSTSALWLSSYHIPWLRTSATRMNERLIHRERVLLVLLRFLLPLAFVFVSMISDDARLYA